MYSSSNQCVCNTSLQFLPLALKKKYITQYRSFLFIQCVESYSNQRWHFLCCTMTVNRGIFFGCSQRRSWLRCWQFNHPCSKRSGATHSLSYMVNISSFAASARMFRTSQTAKTFGFAVLCLSSLILHVVLFCHVWDYKLKVHCSVFESSCEWVLILSNARIRRYGFRLIRTWCCHGLILIVRSKEQTCDVT